MMLSPAVIALLCLAAQKTDSTAEKPIKPLGVVSKEPRLDGALKDFQGTDLRVSKEATGIVSLKAAFRKDTLFVAVSAHDARVTNADAVAVTLFFPSAGTTARGYRYIFGSDGRHADPEGAPSWAQELIRSGITFENNTLNLDLSIPARALPRLPAHSQLALNLCVDLLDNDAGGEPKVLSTCTGGDMAGGPIRLPDELLKNLKLTPPADVEGLEARPTGWVGYAILHYPIWAIADAPLTPASLGELVAGGSAIDPKTVALPLPSSLLLRDNQPIFTVLTGKNPYVGDQCHAEDELRMALYVVKGNTAARALEWPAATCSLGRAMSFELNPDGGLSIGFTNGSTAHFSWSGDHFERSELGQK
jgi:hypothetical protein